MNSEPIKFLIVDDTQENLVALEALLRRDGLEILQARSGTQALELLLVHDVALAFLDVQMPEMNGFELAELMRGAERSKHVPIVFVTAGSRDPQRIFKGYESGAVDFLFKPIEPRILKGKADVFFELYRQRKELANSLRLNEMFVGILGHDLRNPLGTLVTGAQMLEKQIADEKQRRILQRMTSAGRRMTDMIEQILDLTRARLAGGLGFARVRSPVEIDHLLQRSVEELRGAHPDKEIVVDTSGDCSTMGDADRLLQLFSNIVGNALQHGDRGCPVVVTVDGGDDGVVVRVCNQGVMPAAILPHIFDPFRGRDTQSGKSHGLGLGLFISQQIIDAHGGRINAESSEDEGTTFTLRIPRRAVDTKAHGGVGNKMRSLAVDDDENVRESLRDAFEEEGYGAILRRTDSKRSSD